MALHAGEFERLLASSDRTSLLLNVQRLGTALALPQIQALAARAAALTPGPLPLRLALVHTYTSELLQPWLDAVAPLHGLALQTYHAPYGATLSEAQPGSALLAHQPDLTVLMLRREDLHPAFAQPIVGMAADEAQRLRQQALEHLKTLVTAFRSQPVGHLVVTLLPSMHGPALGLHEAQAEHGEGAFWHPWLADFAAWLRESAPSSMLLDLDALISELGRRHAFDMRYWLTSRYPFTPAASLELAQRLMSLGQVLKTPRAKVLVLDADNTLWGGVIGEDGMEGIALGPDFPGNAYMAFQRRLLDLQQRGFVLAMCSKNNAADVDQVLQQHPHQLLKAEHFVARRVNWEAKPDNLLSMAAELNLGLDSFIFVDDSDHECALVRERLPQVEVVQVPKRPHEVPHCLDRVARLEILSLTSEDRAKTAMYGAEAQRRALLQDGAAAGGGLDEHLARLGMRMRVSLNQRKHVSRLAQLTQKTNQFNLTTRRYSEQQIAEFMDSPEWLTFDFSLSDTFGDAGIVGLALINLKGDEAELDSFLMSCRVIGRRAEDAFMHQLLRELQPRGVNRLRASYLPTHKNILVKDLLPRLGFEAVDGGVERFFERDLQRNPACTPDAFPIEIESVIADTQ